MTRNFSIASFVLGTAIVVAPILLAAPAAAQEFDRLEGWLAPSVHYPVAGSFLTLRLTGATEESDLAGYSALARKKVMPALSEEAIPVVRASAARAQVNQGSVDGR